MKNTHLRLKNTEFDWLGYCTSCNVDCCHNTDPSIPKNECIKPGIENKYIKPDDTYFLNRPADDKSKTSESNDYRPLECRLFPFDIKEIDTKLVWIVQDRCHATPKLDYGKSIKFIEGYFSRTIPLDLIQKYVENNKLTKLEKYEANNFKILGEVNWPMK
jgi:hypothetical protein